ncbi:putative uncharacterized oxidoreductase [Lachnellula willkommii]|uniref:Uncharacterized oxidoreductase n=1 Tax=Lachnellula willkommii TaxID=215461 RepID=A0A559MBM0_9HELO|nr:putative uncharacterized oxidoreductase [Lachnellula willkommii]
MPSKGLIFMTGGTGFIGATTTLAALQAGYHLRLAVLQESEISKLKQVFSDHLSSLDFVLVPDIAADGAYAGKLEGVDYIIHIASPTPRTLEKEEIWTPAVKGTLGILAEAAKVGSVKRVVITSSVVALIPLVGVPEGGVIKEDNDWDLTVDKTADFTQETDTGTAFHLYYASKLLANAASWSFMSTQNPQFTLVSLHPTCVVGHHILQTHSSELASCTNSYLFNPIMTGNAAPKTNCVHVLDVADAHLRALDEERVKGNASFLISGAAPLREETVRILEKYYPDAGWKLRTGGGTDVWDIDTGKAERELGMEWRSYEMMVREVMDQQLGLLKAEA